MHVSLEKIDPSQYPADKAILELEDIQKLIPHRFEFTQIHKVLAMDLEERTCVAFRKGEPDEFWVRGHVPGRPIMPGVMMIEVLAQAGVVHGHAQFGMHENHKWVGFGGVEGVRFRGLVEPGEDLWINGRMLRADARRGYLKWQGRLTRADGQIVCEGTIIGMSF
jgi:3-hydroxyacyl-[acyl-carrier-protein] dehydratase